MSQPINGNRVFEAIQPNMPNTKKMDSIIGARAVKMGSRLFISEHIEREARHG